MTTASGTFAAASWTVCPGSRRHHQPFLPLYPLAFESLDLLDYDLVISNKSGFCHGVLTAPETLHICYCLTPTRYLWDCHAYVDAEGIGRWGRIVLAPIQNYLRLWDRQAADRVDHFVSISDAVRRRVEKYYRRDSAVIYPPVEVDRLAPAASHDDYFLIVSRLIPYKRIDVGGAGVQRAGSAAGDCRRRQRPERLQALARPNVTFLGRVAAGGSAARLSQCRAFVFPGLEDFGIAPVEAIAAGRPVIAFAGGGALDTVTARACPARSSRPKRRRLWSRRCGASTSGSMIPGGSRLRLSASALACSRSVSWPSWRRNWSSIVVALGKAASASEPCRDAAKTNLRRNHHGIARILAGGVAQNLDRHSFAGVVLVVSVAMGKRLLRPTRPACASSSGCRRSPPRRLLHLRPLLHLACLGIPGR